MKNIFKSYHLLIVFFWISSCVSTKDVKVIDGSGHVLNTSGITSVTKAESRAQYAFIEAEGLYLNEEYAKALSKYREVLTYVSSQAATHYKISQCNLKLGQEDVAFESAKLAVKHNGHNKTYAYFLADFYKAKNEYLKSIETYQNLIDNTGEVKHYFKTIDVYDELIKQENYKKTSLTNRGNEEAKQQLKSIENKISNYLQEELLLLDKVEEVYGPSFKVTSKKEELFLKTNRLEEALVENQKLIDMDSGHLEHQLRRANVIYGLKSKTEGIDYLKGLLAEKPKEGIFHLVLADFYKGNGQLDKATQQLELAVSLQEMPLEQKVFMVTEMMTSESTLEDRKAALVLAQKIKEIHPTEAQVHSLLGDALLVNGYKLEARDSYYKVLQYDDSKAIIWHQILDLDGELLQLDSLENHLAQAMEKFPEELKYYIIMGDIQVQNKQFENAQHVLEKGLSRAKNNFKMAYEFHLRLGDVYYNLEEYDKCYQSFEKALEYDPNNVYALNNYSYYLAESKGNLDIAKANGERLIRISPEDYNYLDTYAWVLYKRGELEEAYIYIKKASKGGNGVVLEHAGDIAFELGKNDEAVVFWEKAKATGEASNLIDIKINENKLP